MKSMEFFFARVLIRYTDQVQHKSLGQKMDSMYIKNTVNWISFKHICMENKFVCYLYITNSKIG